MEEFYADALKTESLDLPAIRSRMSKQDTIDDENVMFIEAIELLGSLDVLKKHLFYGKSMSVALPHELWGNALPHENFEESDDFIRLEHAVLGVLTEGAELLEALFKHKYMGQPLDWTNIGEEVADVNWYEAIFDDLLKKNTGQGVMEWNQKVIQKLKARYGDKFDAEKAINRNVDEERVILDG